ncbi:Zn-ribbon domain-containing OB-fold protein [Halorientalis pallida]|uniref:Nucleic acid-binding protein n=1 Tax=Halorientalis pallida TaxID=2479928 RepID=A0A498KV15_9EURY|nr:OB-fold domain-containing protein [Halorientalis pallida]RXK49017.1 nucleic acid-binding protein [Halorientalis pallida]
MSMDAIRCPNGHVKYPTHPRCPECGEEPVETIDLSDRTGEVVTWTESTATPPGVREPNVLAFVEFDVEGTPVRALGQIADNADVETGDEVEPVYAEELREPGVGLKPADADQEWDGYRFRLSQ